jgi:hypothetical protein
MDWRVGMSVTAKKEWIGEAGYCNCLLVAMARMPIPTVHLFSNLPVPDLDALTATRPATASWIRAQGFRYPNLNPLTVIQMFTAMGNISSFLWWYRPGHLEVVDCVEHDGPTVKRMFHMSLSKKNGILHLHIEIDPRQEVVNIVASPERQI